ncbi:MAG: mannose-1-phosphate guanylyltransferase [Spirulina sp. SIO3F2]|nr:mannose-1-phosphate guanylyltransferase [Spirulina sp. SIO3F2]
MTQPLIPVILAGGKGERFWPLSRRQRPKQFLTLDDSGRSLLQGTADRLLNLAGGWKNLWVITSAQVANGVREQLPELPERNILVEPQGRDTAPAVAWATLEVAQAAGEDAVLGFFPADHWIGNQTQYEQTLQAATELASTEDAIVTLGIQPNTPATGYGYIEQGAEAGEYIGQMVYKVSRFTEKPDRATAEQFISTGRFSWNSGMFIFRASVVLQELAQHAPELLQALQSQGQAAYATLEKKSIDYALMEKTQLAYVLPADFGWDDLGDWNALERLHQAKAGNVAIARHAIMQDTHGAIIYNGDDSEAIVTIGLEDVVIVREGNATLVVHKSRTQEIKSVLKQLGSDEELKKFL